MFDQLKTLSALMKNAGSIKQRAEQMKAELERRTVEGESGSGAVRVVMNGKFRVLRLSIDKPVMIGGASGDQHLVEDLVATAVNNAIEKVQKLVAEEMKKAAGGLDIPGLENMLN